MSFNSVWFLIFFPVTSILYFALPHRWRWVHLLAASCVFYMFFVPAYLLILLGMIGVDYVAGRLIERSTGTARRVFLCVSIVTNLSVLAFFKYFNFLESSFAHLAALFGLGYAGSPLNILLPIGLSFHTFQAMSYTIEVYRGRQPAERHLGIFALYVMFYPQLVAGPIERPQNLLHQFREPHVFDFDRICAGLTRMLWGFFKKLVIADRLAVFVDAAYGSPQTCGRGWLILATYLFAVQIYCDFSGYIDIALGTAQVMGFTLMENFDRPYTAESVSDFWRRWHISLSSWFRDYLYIPLGGNRVSPGRWVFNVMLVFLLSGLWHGASWAFVLWGALHGAYVVIDRLLQRDRSESARSDWPGPLRIFITFNLVCFAWIFFRAGSVAVAWEVIRRIFGPAASVGLAPFNSHSLPLMLILIGLLGWVELVGRGRPVAVLRNMPVYMRWPAYYGLIIVILWVGVLGQRSFIYFQF